jgi:hypothetical protein
MRVPHGVGSFIVACWHGKQSVGPLKQSASGSESLNAFGVVAEHGGARDVDAF